MKSAARTLCPLSPKKASAAPSLGQSSLLEVVYPGDFGDARLAGKTVSYDITVKAIKHKRDFPERDDEFAKELGALRELG